jgi:hypothetical protein
MAVRLSTAAASALQQTNDAWPRLFRRHWLHHRCGAARLILTDQSAFYSVESAMDRQQGCGEILQKLEGALKSYS